MSEPTPVTTKILGADGRPLPPRDRTCPRCKAGPERRRLSSGFGDPHDLCSQCGYEFEERTCDA
jgi:hypothetical protein